MFSSGCIISVWVVKKSTEPRWTSAPMSETQKKTNSLDEISLRQKDFGIRHYSFCTRDFKSYLYNRININFRPEK